MSGGSIGIRVSGGVSLSPLAQRFWPGPAPSQAGAWGAGAFLAVAALIFMAYSFGAGFFFLIVAVVGTAIAIKQKTDEYPVWEEKLRIYEYAWICLQCGQTWIPQ
jgi:hypothetical protein